MAATAVVPHRHADGGHGQQQRQQRRQQQKLLRPLQGTRQHVRALSGLSQTLIRLQTRRQIGVVARQRLAAAGQAIAIAHPAARLYDPAALGVRQRNQHPGGAAQQAEPTVRLPFDLADDPQRHIPHLHGIAGAQGELRHQPRSDQRLAGARHLARRARLQPTVQRVGVVHRLHLRQLQPTAGKRHG
ncbi:hypothetical protein DCF39_13690 [Edwardsiella piscicida]|nr:hypothetical protein [Edwardsiella piscicida]UCQ36305.1 hypothetical protein DCF34_13095 [Edwardsiella piscicida]UCQ46259.1 hypothetical protein DCF39_13690 [Edwardsiella piscicida]